MSLMSRIILFLNAAVIALIGLAYLYDPNVLLANYGLSTDGPGIDNMLRGTYGGLFLCMAGLFGWGVINTARRSDALGLLALFMGGQALGRIASLAMVGMPDVSILSLLAYEIIMFAIALFLYRQTAST